ncbi:limonene-1,2-epoxide hydrolase family protein [Mycolicibacterium sp. D5.8-2]|uniref:limonene-1,2-epoxide hydrolase family protein n=1 Tax=Mycolicibacterium TaxID=1866885 RepID=UPI00399A8EFE
MLGDEGEWVAGPPPIPVTHGAQEAVGLLEGFRANYDLTTIDVELLHIGMSNKVIYTERVDHLIDSTGRRFISLPIAGIMRLADKPDDNAVEVAYWRDYWDMRDFLDLPTA